MVETRHSDIRLVLALAARNYSKMAEWQQLAMFRLSYGLREKTFVKHFAQNRKSKRSK